MHYTKHVFYRYLTALLLFVTCFVIGCSEAPTAPLAEESLAAESGLSAGKASSMRVPFAQSFPVPCANGGAGEDVLVSGTLHIVSNFNIDNSGGVHGKIHFQPQEATGLGLITGDTYQATGVTQQTMNVNAGGLPFTATFVNNFRLIAPGPGNNLQVHQTIHTTINENGVLTADVDNSSVECR